MTNGDKIRNMTNEELAVFFVSEDAQVCAHCDYYDGETMKCICNGLCLVEGQTETAKAVLISWLSSQALSERSENPCEDCKYFIGEGFGCSFDGPCSHNV